MVSDFTKFLIKITLLILVVFVAVIGTLYGSMSWAAVDTGNAMLIIDTTKPEGQRISQPILGPTAGFYFDGFKHMIGLQYGINIYYATDSYEDTIPCFSSDQLEMQITVQMRWQLNTTKLLALYRSYPRLDYESTAIDSIMEETIRLVTKNFTSVDTVLFREQVAAQMEQHVFEKIAAEPSLMGALSYLRFDLKNIAYPAAYTTAIESKLIKEQEKLAAEYERTRILILANATAQESIIKAAGEAQAKMIIANGTKQAITMIITASGSTSEESAKALAELYLSTEAMKQIAPYVDKIIFITKEGQFFLIPTDG